MQFFRIALMCNNPLNTFFNFPQITCTWPPFFENFFEKELLLLDIDSFRSICISVSMIYYVTLFGHESASNVVYFGSNSMKEPSLSRSTVEFITYLVLEHWVLGSQLFIATPRFILNQYLNWFHLWVKKICLKIICIRYEYLKQITVCK